MCASHSDVETDVSSLVHCSDGAWFTESWLGRIKDDVGDNRRIKVNMISFFMFASFLFFLGRDLPINQ